jgi:hypothetical protein
VVRPVIGKNSGYVAVGRSLREIEVREDNLLKITGLAWLVGFILWLAIIAARRLYSK